MKKQIALIAAVGILVLQSAYAEPKVKKETIVVEGKLGTIKEERVKSVQSNITFVPSGGAASYDLIDLSDGGSNGVKEHVESQQLTIPSWTLFSW